MFRDLKPQNIGFDGKKVMYLFSCHVCECLVFFCRYSSHVYHSLSLIYHLCLVRGDVKIFDFGLATVMPPNGDPYEEKFVMSGAGKI